MQASHPKFWPVRYIGHPHLSGSLPFLGHILLPPNTNGGSMLSYITTFEWSSRYGRGEAYSFTRCSLKRYASCDANENHSIFAICLENLLTGCSVMHSFMFLHVLSLNDCRPRRKTGFIFAVLHKSLLDFETCCRSTCRTGTSTLGFEGLLLDLYHSIPRAKPSSSASGYYLPTYTSATFYESSIRPLVDARMSLLSI